jgi:hypothetical protein
LFLFSDFDLLFTAGARLSGKNPSAIRPKLAPLARDISFGKVRGGCSPP